MAQDIKQLAAQLEKMNARLDRALKTRRGSGPLRATGPFFCGALLGAGAALLYAPQTGERTREFLRRNAGELQESASQGAQTTKDKIQNTATTAKGTAQQTLTQVTDKVNATVQDGRARTNGLVQGTKGAVRQDGGKTQQEVGADGAKVQAAADTTADKTAQAPRARTTPPPQAS